MKADELRAAAEMLEGGDRRREALLTMASGYDGLAETSEADREKLATLRRLRADVQRLIDQSKQIIAAAPRRDKGSPPG